MRKHTHGPRATIPDMAAVSHATQDDQGTPRRTPKKKPPGEPGGLFLQQRTQHAAYLLSFSISFATMLAGTSS